MNYRVLVFCKPLISGLVKTRLAASIGNEKALLIYKLLTESVVSNLPQGNVTAYVSQQEGAQQVADWLNCPVHIQRGDTLGERMISAIEDEFERGYTNVVIIGSDTIFFEPKHLDQALRNLTTKPVTISPSTDGGFWLIGISEELQARSDRSRKAAIEGLFELVEWSSSDVLHTVLRNADRGGLEVALGDELSDVDTIDDLHRVIKNVPSKFEVLARQIRDVIDTN